MQLRIPVLACAVVLAAVGIARAAAAAEAYPQRSIRLLIPYPPGGAGDIVGRLLSARLSESLGQQVVVDNRGGGAQIIATEIVAKAPPDGYTLFLASATHGINPGLQKKLPYDSIRDFAPITLVASSPLVFVAHPSLGVGNIQELVAAARAQPGRINYGSSGPGTGGHLSIELLSFMAGVKFTHVPYKGAGPALVDLIGGQVQIVCTSPLPAMPHVKSGKLRALAMTGRTRSRATPEIPTVAEAGYPGYESSLWYALLAPARTPSPVISYLHTQTVNAIKSPNVTAQLLAQGAEPVGNSPRELDIFLRAEIDRWTKLIERAQIRAD